MTTATVAVDHPEQLSARTRTALLAMALAVFVIANDITSLGVALPSVEKDLHVGVGTAQWVMNVYTLVFGVLIVTGGRVCDLFGRRRMFLVGISIFAGCSVLAGVAPNVVVLIGARAAMAVGAALIWPAVVGLTFGLVPAARAGLAGALLLGVSGVGNALGPVIGGLLTDELSWRWILFLNVPLAALAAVVVLLRVDRDDAAAESASFDWAGLVALTAGLVAVLVALDQGSSWGWTDLRVIGLLVFGVASLAVLVLIERRAGTTALIPRDVMASVPFTAACLATLLASGTWFAVLLYAPQFMEKVLGFSALRAGLGFLPLMVVFSAAAFAAGPLYNRIGAKAPLLVGAACIPAGALLLSLPGEHAGYAELLPAFVVLGLGVGLFYSTLTTAALTSIPPERSGVGGGLTFMFQLVGGAIGVGLATSVYTARTGSGHDVVPGIQGALRVVALVAVCAVPMAWLVVRHSSRPNARPRIQHTHERHTMSIEENKAIVRRVYDAINARDVAALDGLIAEDVVSNTPFPQSDPGLAGFREAFSQVLAAFPDYKVVVHDQIAEGDEVVTRYTSGGTQQGDIQGVAGSGQHVELLGIDIDRVVDGRIVEHWSEAGTDQLRVKRGLVLPR